MEKKKSRVNKRKRKEWIRFLVQLLFFLLAPSVYSAAFAGVKNSVTMIGQGRPLEMTSFVLQLLLVCAATVIAGRYFCGWACAFGTLNDVIYRVSSWIQKKVKRKLPGFNKKLLALLRFTKYLILIIIIVACFTQNASYVTPNSPWTAFSLLRSWHIDALKGCKIGGVVLVLLIPGMALQERFFCQCFCPMGAVFSLLPVFPLLQLKREKEKCPEKCGACKKVCPVDILIDSENPFQGECIRCGRCKSICPRNNIKH